MPSSLINKSYILIASPYIFICDGRVGPMSLIHEFKAFMISYCKINNIQELQYRRKQFWSL